MKAVIPLLLRTRLSVMVCINAPNMHLGFSGKEHTSLRDKVNKICIWELTDPYDYVFIILLMLKTIHYPSQLLLTSILYLLRLLILYI